MKKSKTRGSAVPAKDDAIPKYTMDPTFEGLVCAAIWASPRAWKALGRILRPEAMPSNEGRILVRLAKVSAGDTGTSAGGLALAYQVAETLASEGDKDGRSFIKALGFLEHSHGMFEAGETDYGSVLNLALAELRRYEQDKAAGNILDRWSKKLDASGAVGEWNTADAIGAAADMGQQVLTPADRRRVIIEAAVTKVMPTGIPSLDAGLDGGLVVGNVGLIVGGPGDGKSSTLSQIHAFTAGALRIPSALASCELKARQNILKFEAALWGIPINVLKANPTILDERYETDGHKVAPFFFRHWDLPRGKPTIREVFEWIDENEQRSQVKIELVGIDHFDRFDSSNAPAKSSDYAKSEFVYDEIASEVSEREMVAWVPSHCVRQKSGALWGPGDMAHSQHKEKRCDAAFSVTAQGKAGARTVTGYLFKNREGEANLIFGPEPAAFAYGCSFPVDILTRTDDTYEGL